MRKSSRSISLALIGSALLLGGCQPAADDNEWTEEKDVAQTDNGSGNDEWSEGEVVAPAGENATLDGVATGNAQYNHNGGGMGRGMAGVGGAMIGSQIGRSIGRGMGGNPGYAGNPGYGRGGVDGGGAMPASPSSRGGFGSSGGGFGGGSASS